MPFASDLLVWTLLHGPMLGNGQQLACQRQDAELGLEENSVLLQTRLSGKNLDDAQAPASQHDHLEERLHSRPSAAGLQVATRTSWPTFASIDALKQDQKWHKYLRAVYGPSVDDPSVFPIDVSKFWVLEDAGLDVASSPVPSCPRHELAAFAYWMHSPAHKVWIFQPPPFVGLPSNSRAEVAHSIPAYHNFEREQYWMYYAPGSGIFYNVGRTKVYQHHSDVVKEFVPVTAGICTGTTQVGKCVKLAMQRASKYYDSLQFVNHPDQACGTIVKHTPQVVPFEIVDLRHTGLVPCGLKVDGGLGKARAACTCDTKKNYLNCDFGFKLVENTLSLSSLTVERHQETFLTQFHWDVVAVTTALLLSLSAILVQQVYQKHHSPIKMAALSCAFFGIDNFLIAYAGTYLHVPNAHMAVMFFVIGFLAIIFHLLLMLACERYRAQMWAMLGSTKTILVCIALTATAVDAAEVCSNIGFSLDPPASGPYQALASCNVLIVCPFFYYFYGETLTRLQLFGMAFLIIGATFISDVSQWALSSISLYGFLWLMLSMLFYSMSDITLRFSSIVGLAWQPRVMFMLFIMGVTGFPMYFIDRGQDGFKEYYQSPSLVIWPILNAAAGILGLLTCTIAFEAPEAPCGVLSAIVNANSAVLVVLNKVILGYSPSLSKTVGMGFIMAGVSVFHACDVANGSGKDSESCTPMKC